MVLRFLWDAGGAQCRSTISDIERGGAHLELAFGHSGVIDVSVVSTQKSVLQI
jgi:hypothetical protein